MVVFWLLTVICSSATAGYTRVGGSDAAGDGSESTIDGSDHKNDSRISTIDGGIRTPSRRKSKIPIH